MWIALWGMWACGAAVAGAAQPGAVPPAVEEPDWGGLVLKLTVTRADGMTELGSAVPLGGERLVTNCHVLRDAVRIEAHGPGRVFEARSDRHDAYRDMCLLSAPGLQAASPPMVEVGDTRVGLAVAAVGYPGGEFRVSRGGIVGLHACECDGGKVIQTSAPFDRGASGGGLFDQRGRLVGILSFKARIGGNFHFALPVGWLRHVAGQQAGGGAGMTFWEQPGRESGYFLTACDLGAKRSWRPLSRLAGDWTTQEPANPEAWMALGRARQGLGQAEDAAVAYHKVLLLDSTHAEAKWALRELEFELGRDLAAPDGL
jgi:hypothetical protein